MQVHDFARHVVIFCVDKNSSSLSENRKNNFLVLGQGPIYGINGNFGSSEKNFSVDFSKGNTKFCLSMYYNIDNILC